MPGIFHQFKSDEALILAYQKGDARAFEVLYGRHKDPLFNFLFNSVQQLPQVEDLAQDVWMSIIRSIESYKPVASFRTYLYRIARNRIIDHWRKHGSKEPEEFDEEAHRQAEIPMDENQRAMVVSEILQALATLPEEQRETLLLKEEGFSHQEIADITNANSETVKSRLRYARKSLESLAKDMGEEP